MNSSIIQLKGDDYHMLGYAGAIDGFQLLGFNGGMIGIYTNSNMIALSNAGVAINTGFTVNGPTTFTKPLTIGTSGSTCNSMQFGSFTGVSNATQTVTYTTAFPAGIIPKVILTVVNTGQSYPTGNAFIVSESLTGFTYNFSFVSSTVFVHAENFVKINWMALQG
jgi:hypothetical protein